MTLVNIGIAGCLGRMGQALVKEIVNNKHINFAGGFEHPQHEGINKKISDFIEINADHIVSNKVVERSHSINNGARLGMIFNNTFRLYMHFDMAWTTDEFVSNFHRVSKFVKACEDMKVTPHIKKTKEPLVPASKVVIKMLGPSDRLSITIFDDRAETVFNLTEMTDDAKERAIATLDRLKPRGATDLWKGIKEGLNSLNVGGTNLKNLIVLTDGVPNRHPPEGYIEAFQSYKNLNPNLKVQLTMVGFGGKLDSELLQEIAIQGDGAFLFVPDASGVAPIFVNIVAIAMLTWIHKPKIHFKPINGSEIVDINENYITTCFEKIISPPSFHYGQKYEILLNMKNIPENGPYLEVKVDGFNEQKSILLAK